MFSNLSRDILNHELPSLSPVPKLCKYCKVTRDVDSTSILSKMPEDKLLFSVHLMASRALNQNEIFDLEIALKNMSINY